MASEDKKLVKYFRAFGDRTRFRILTLLADREMTVNEITDKIGLSQPTVSRHLGILRDVEAVIDRREGQNVYYSLNKRAVESCCSGMCDFLELRISLPKKRKK